MKRSARLIPEWIWLPFMLLALVEPTLSERYRNRIYMEGWLHGMQRHPGMERHIGCVTLEVHADYVLAACGNPVGWIGAGN